jgi:membrane-associated phospholipid phosphatase
MTSQSTSPGRWRLGTAAAGGLCLVSTVVAGIALGDRVPPLDSWILDHLYSRPGTAPATVATAISGVGTIVVLAVLLATVTGLLRRYGARGVRLLPRYGALLAICLTTVAMQAAFRRSGPPVTAQDWTYPSGHVTVLSALAFTTFVISAGLTRMWRAVVLASSTTVVVVVAAGRVTLGEHYLVDVVAALFATVGAGLLAIAALGPAPRSGAMPRGPARAHS